MMKDQLNPVRQMAIAEGTENGEIIAVASGKGGVGKSNLALNLSIALAEKGRSVTLFDANLQMANVDILLGERGDFGLSDVLMGEKSLAEVAYHEVEGLKVVFSSTGNYDLAGMEDSVKEHFFREFYRLKFVNDFILVDTSAGLNRATLEFTAQADRVILVTTPEPTAISDTYAMIKVLNGMSSDLEFHVLINQARDAREALEVYERFSLVVNHFLDADSRYLGHVVEDGRVREAVKIQKPFVRLFPGCQAAQCVVRIAEKMLL